MYLLNWSRMGEIFFGFLSVRLTFLSFVEIGVLCKCNQATNMVLLLCSNINFTLLEVKDSRRLRYMRRGPLVSRCMLTYCKCKSEKSLWDRLRAAELDKQTYIPCMHVIICWRGSFGCNSFVICVLENNTCRCAKERIVKNMETSIRTAHCLRRGGNVEISKYWRQVIITQVLPSHFVHFGAKVRKDFARHVRTSSSVDFLKIRFDALLLQLQELVTLKMFSFF